MKTRTARQILIVALAAIAGAVLGLQFQRYAEHILGERLASDHRLLAIQRAELVKGSLRKAEDNLEDIGHLFKNSEEVTPQEFAGFTADWDSWGITYAAYRGDTTDKPYLGMLPQSRCSAVAAVLADEKLSPSIASRAVYCPETASWFLLLITTVGAPHSQIIRIISIVDIPLVVEHAILPTEEFGLPTTIRLKGNPSILFFHQPRLDAAMGHPLLAPETAPGLSFSETMEIGDTVLEIKVDASPAFMAQHRNRLPTLIPPTLALMAALFACTLGSLIRRGNLALAERKLAISQLERFFELDLGLLCILTQEGKFVRVNSGWQELLGYTEEELIGHLNLEFIHPDDRAKTAELMASLMAGKPDHHSVNRYRTRQGDYRTIEWRGMAANELIYGAAHDVTEREEYEAQLRSALAEKATLLKEVHHRVKNNLQIISSMLNLQDGETSAASFSDAITAAQGRIRAMAMVHETLYQGESISGVDFQDYMSSLVSLFSMQESGQAIHVQMHCDPIVLSIDLAIHSGLLLNELATNSVKHAFKAGESAILSISLREEEGIFRLSEEDNGPGTPEGFDSIRDSHLGIKLAESLANQLGGKDCHLQISRSAELGGARFLVEFSPDRNLWHRVPKSV